MIKRFGTQNLIIFLFIFPNIALCQQILLDESFTDWQSANVTSYNDKNGDGNTSGIDFTDVRISNDDQYLYIYFDLKKEINIQQNNFITLFLDLDHQSSTGLNISGIGADLVYYLGPKNGKFYSGTLSTSVFHNDIGLITSPTVTSSQFELGIKRTFSTSLGNGRMGDKIRLLISDENVAGDRAPDQSGGYSYTLDLNKKFNPLPFSLQKEKKEFLRFLSYNVLRDRMFQPQYAGAYDRVLKAIQPDIIGICEIYDNNSAQTAAFVENILPSSFGQKWHHSGLNPDIRLVSRYPILQSRSIDGNGAFLIDLGYSKLVYIVAHLPCCENDVQRQQEVDNIMSFVRSIRFGISPFQVPQNTPIIISGDMNFVGLRQQPKTFLTGDIADNSRYGPDFRPDWDESELQDAVPVTTNTPATFTWYNDNGTFSAGRLDYFYFTNSVIDLKNSFVLWTPALTNSQLVTAGLRKSDIEECSDHLPVICDFLVKSSVSSTAADVEIQKATIKVEGNEIKVTSPEKGILYIYDMTGRLVNVTEIMENDADNNVPLSVCPLQGIYFVHLLYNQKHVSKKIMVIK